MPELPEVESVRRGVHDFTAGARITAAEVIDPRILGTTSQRRIDSAAADGFISALAGLRILRAERRGKFMWLEVARTIEAEPSAETESTAEAEAIADVDSAAESSDRGHALASPNPIAESEPIADGALLIHLGMSGQLRVYSDDRDRHRHTRAVIHLQRGGEDYELRFVDQRIFGHLGIEKLVPSAGRLVPASARRIAPDPLEPAFDVDAVLERLSRKRTALKAALLDQNLLSGIGNIYADEALFRAGLHPLAIPARTRPARLRAVLDAATEVMSDALTVGGTSFDALYVNVNGESGYFDRSLRAYGRVGRECLRCAETMAKLVVAGRTSHFCPSCQRRR